MLISSRCAQFRFVDAGEDGAMFTDAKFGRAILADPDAKAYQVFDSGPRPNTGPTAKLSRTHLLWQAP